MLKRIWGKGRRLLGHALYPREYRRRQEIDRVCIGYSHLGHWLSFKTILRHYRPRSVAILGVYYGRDIAYLKSLEPSLRIVGVDRFADIPGEDWPDPASKLSWVEAGFGPAPALQAARANLEKLGVAQDVRLIQGEAAEFLRTCQEKFDLIYIDVSHDYETTRELLTVAAPCLNPGGILAGDDFSNQGTWGVERAVREQIEAERLHVFLGNVWLARPLGSRPPVFSRLLV